jgi:hypothetical protein
MILCSDDITLIVMAQSIKTLVHIIYSPADLQHFKIFMHVIYSPQETSMFCPSICRLPKVSLSSFTIGMMPHIL